MPKVSQAIILLAGVGSRLKPLTDQSHKALLTIGNQTILERQLSQLARHGVSRFHLVLGYRADDIRAFVKNRFPNLDVVFHVNEVYDKTNTAYSLFLVLKLLRESYLLLDGDVVLADALIAKLCVDTTETLLLCETDPAKLDTEAVKAKAHADGRITSIGKHIPITEALGESIGVGLYQRDWAEALHGFLLTALTDTANWNWYYEDAMERLLTRGTAPSPLKVVSTEEHVWVEVDDHNDLARARSMRW